MHRINDTRIVAYLALVAALASGVAYAADKIGSKQIKRNAVLAKHVGDGVIGSAEVADDSLTGADVDEATLRGGPAGPQGVPGPPGPPGSPDSPEQVLAKLLQVDGAGSGLDADTLGGSGPGEFLRDQPRGVRISHLPTLPGAWALAGSSQVIGSSEQIALSGEMFSELGVYTPPADALIASVSGTYVINGYINWGLNTEGERSAIIRVGGANVAVATDAPSSRGATRQYVTAIVRATAGAEITLVGQTTSQDSVATTSVTGLGFAGLRAQWVSP